MTRNLISSPRSYHLYFVAIIVIAILVILPNQRTAAHTLQSSSQQGAGLTPENLEKESYRLWLECFQAWKQGGKPNVPNLGILNGVDQTEAQRVRAVWERSKMRAFFAVAEKDMYQESLNWWRAKAQGQQMTPPVLRYPDVFDETQIKRIEAVWQQGYDKAHLIVFEEGAYQTWLGYYQAIQQGSQPTLPELSINEGIKSQEAKNAQVVWTRAQARAQRKVQQSGQALTARAKQPSVSANNVAALSDGKTTDSLPDVVVDNETRQQAARSYIPLLDVPVSSNAYQQPSAGFNQPTTIAALSSFSANGSISQLRSSPQQSQMGATNSPETITANNNRLITESNAEIRKAKTTVNIDTAKKLVEKHDSEQGRTNINTAAAGGVQLVRQYTYGLQGPISMRQLINGQWVTSFFIYDGEGNIRMLTDENGNVTDTYDYDAWGNVINHTGNTPNNRLYHGEEWDPDLSMYYLRSRYYQPQTGRFHTMDSFNGRVSEPLSLHKYLYAHGNPINNHDPSGLYATEFTIASVITTSPTFFLLNALAPAQGAGSGMPKPTKFQAGFLWGNSNVSDDQRREIISIVDQLTSNQTCKNWFKSTINNIFSKYKSNATMFPTGNILGDDLTSIFSTTSINFYRHPNDALQLGALPKPNPLVTLATDQFAGGVMQTLNRGTTTAQVVISREYFGFTGVGTENHKIATDLMHEMFHVAGMHRGSDPLLPDSIPVKLGFQSNDLRPQVLFEDIDDNCTNSIK